ncbi:MAG: hypothetical protein Q7S16_05160 [bacterium]|nr:hypothetical protein [bacterium]
MAQTLQDIFLRIQEKKDKRKDVRRMYKDVLDASPKYREIMEEATKLREKKSQIVTAIQSECADELAKIDALTSDIASDETLLTDMAITQYTKGESITIQDEFANTYEPVFAVKFKKSRA